MLLCMEMSQSYLQGHQHVQWSHTKHDLMQGSKEAGSYLEDPVNASADVGKGLHEGVKARLTHCVEGVSGCLGLLLCLLQLLHAAPLTLLHNRLQLIITPSVCLQMQNCTKSNDPELQYVPPDLRSCKDCSQEQTQCLQSATELIWCPGAFIYGGHGEC